MAGGVQVLGAAIREERGLRLLAGIRLEAERKRCHALTSADVNLIPASVHHKDLVRPSIGPSCTRYWFTMTNMIQLCGDFAEPEHVS